MQRSAKSQSNIRRTQSASRARYIRLLAAACIVGSAACALAAGLPTVARPSRVRISSPTVSSRFQARPTRRRIAQVNNGKKLIWWNPEKGPKDLTPQDLANGSAVFDGFVVQPIKGSKDTTYAQTFAWSVFSNRRYTLDPNDSGSDYIGDSLSAMKNLPSTPMPERFLRVNTSPYDVQDFDWTDDAFWNNVAHNLTVASDFCNQANLRGIFLDTEQYHRPSAPNMYLYNDLIKDPRYKGMSYNQMESLVERRGGQVMQALNSHQRNPIIFISFGYTTVSSHTERGRIASRGFLLQAFFDGMLAKSTPQTVFVDGLEQASYWHDDKPDYFANWRRIEFDSDKYNMRFQKYPARYKSQWTLGPGPFIDRDRDEHGKFGVYGWCGDNKARMFYSPARLAYVVQEAGKAADNYVWIYSQRPNCWLPVGAPGGLPKVYADALIDGMRHANNPSLPSLPQNTSTIAESAICH